MRDYAKMTDQQLWDSMHPDFDSNKLALSSTNTYAGSAGRKTQMRTMPSPRATPLPRPQAPMSPSRRQEILDDCGVYMPRSITPSPATVKPPMPLALSSLLSVKKSKPMTPERRAELLAMCEM